MASFTTEFATADLQQQWVQEQLRLRGSCKIEDSGIIKEKINAGTLYVGGLDISYCKADSSLAFVGISIVKPGDLPSKVQCETLLVDSFKVNINLPYVYGFLGFREVPAYIEAIQAFKEKHPAAPSPDIWMVDANGTLHPRRFGAACHLGVEFGQPTIGVAKNLPLLENEPNGFPPDCDIHQQKKLLQTRFNSLRQSEKIDLYGPNGTVDGVALRNSLSKNPVFVSPGHMVTLETAIDLTLRCSIYRVPEPTRQADIRSRADVTYCLNLT
ncbi:hypothetical protein Aperf_G00000015242 [Anoplocephala perfoliata]